MNKKALAAQLVSIRAAVDALLVQLEDAEPAEGTDACPHPQAQRQDLTVMGGPMRWRCGVCGHEESVED